MPDIKTESGDEKRYHVSQWDVNNASDEQLVKWAHDPNCIEMDVCAKTFAERFRGHPPRVAEETPFNPRAEVSADARHIVKHVWIIFVLLPFVLGLLWAIANATR